MKQPLPVIFGIVFAAVLLQTAVAAQPNESLSEINAREYGLWPLEKLTGNPDDIEVRIFYFGGLFSGSALVLKKTGTESGATYYPFPSPTRGQAAADLARRVRTPNVPWREVWDYLAKNGFYAIRDQHAFGRPMLVLDSPLITVETLQGNRYRTFSYASPQARSESDPKRLVSTVEYLEHVFDIRIFPAGRPVMLTALWLPIVLSAVFVFIASALINMFLKFWHTPDYRKLANEDEVRAAVRSGNPAPGKYVIPWCVGPEAMKDPAMQEKMAQGPVGMLILRRSGSMNMGASLLQWLLFCILTSLLCAILAFTTLPAGADHHLVFHTVALAAVLGYAFGPFPNAIWWGFPWKATFKYIVDGVVYAIITGLTFMWLWPAA